MQKAIEVVVSGIIKTLENIDENNKPMWRQEWVAPLPQNINGRPYTGINALRLMVEMMVHGWESPVFATYKMAKKAGGYVLPKEDRVGGAVPIVFFRQGNCYKKTNEETGETEERVGLLARYYNVFHVDTCTTLEAPPTQFENDPIEEAQALCDAFFSRDGSPTLLSPSFDGRAWYTPKRDEVGIPSLSSFRTPHAYYSTLFHEMAHSTGHGSRLSRFSGDGSDFDRHGERYSTEELIAELTAMLLCSRFGVRNERSFDNSIAYLSQWWLRVDKKAECIKRAATAAQKAFDFIVG